MSEQSFYKKYPALGGILGGHFDDIGDDESEEEMAQRIIDEFDYAPEQIRRWLNDIERLLPNLNEEWQLLGKEAQTYFENAEQARDWITRIYAVWDAALKKHEGRRAS